MGQVNIALDDHILATLDRIAATKGLRRPDLLRQAITELIEAHDAGRLAFQTDQAPKLDASVNGLIHQLRELVIELDRAQADNARLFGKLIEQSNGGEEANRLALEKLTARLNDINRKTYQPFLDGVNKVVAASDALPQGMYDQIKPWLYKIGEELRASNTLARVPRRQYALVLGDDRALSLRFLSGCAAIVLVAGMLIGFILPTQFDGFALSQAAHLIDGPERMCRLIGREYAVRDCKVPDTERELGVKVIAHEDRQ